MMPNVFVVLEAAASVALSHEESCDCTVCVAVGPRSDKQRRALVDLLVKVYETGGL